MFAEAGLGPRTFLCLIDFLVVWEDGHSGEGRQSQSKFANIKKIYGKCLQDGSYINQNSSWIIDELKRMCWQGSINSHNKYNWTSSSCIIKYDLFKELRKDQKSLAPSIISQLTLSLLTLFLRLDIYMCSMAESILMVLIACYARGAYFQKPFHIPVLSLPEAWCTD